MADIENRKLQTELSDKLSSLEVIANKLQVVSDSITQDLFAENGCSDNKIIQFKYSYKSYQTLSEILSDYNFQMINSIQNLQEIIKDIIR